MISKELLSEMFGVEVQKEYDEMNGCRIFENELKESRYEFV